MSLYIFISLLVQKATNKKAGNTIKSKDSSINTINKTNAIQLIQNNNSSVFKFILTTYNIKILNNMFKNNYNKLYKLISIGAIASLGISRLIRRVSDIDLLPRYVKLFLIIIALMFGGIYWYKKDTNASQ